MIPGIQPHKVRIKTINIEPHPLSNTAKGGNNMDKMTLNNDIAFSFSFCENSKK